MNELMSTVDIGGPLHCLIDAYVPESSLPSLNENASSDLKEFYHEATMLTCDDVVDMQFNSAVSSADKTDYIIAATSGVITATLDLILSDQFSLTEASDWGYERTSSFVVKTAQHLGYSGASSFSCGTGVFASDTVYGYGIRDRFRGAVLRLSVACKCNFGATLCG